MGIMASSTWYLPSEVLHYRNYPEINYVLPQINDIIDYAMRINNAISDYNSGVFDKVDVNISDLGNYIALCRTVCATLGNAPNVCYDILLELRKLQNVFQSIMSIRNEYGSQYIGTPTSSS